MIPIETPLLQELRKHALALRTLAYALPTGWARHEIVQLADRLIATTDRLAAKEAAERLSASAKEVAQHKEQARTND